MFKDYLITSIRDRSSSGTCAFPLSPVSTIPVLGTSDMENENLKLFGNHMLSPTKSIKLRFPLSRFGEYFSIFTQLAKWGFNKMRVLMLNFVWQSVFSLKLLIIFLSSPKPQNYSLILPHFPHEMKVWCKNVTRHTKLGGMFLHHTFFSSYITVTNL